MRSNVRSKNNRRSYLRNHGAAIMLSLCDSDVWKDYAEKFSVQSFTLTNSTPLISQQEDFKDLVILDAYTDPLSPQEDNDSKS